MATLSGIGITVLAGTCTLTISLISFGLAIRAGYNSQIAPRTWSRPKSIIKNAITGHNKTIQNKLRDGTGGFSYWYLWIPWSLKLRYHDLLQGIPYTGTRKDGKQGPLLKCTLDSIVLIRMHEVGLKVSFLATLLCLCVILPLTITAKCKPEDIVLATLPPTNITSSASSVFTNNDTSSRFLVDNIQNSSITTAATTNGTLTDGICKGRNANLTNYGRTTIAHIPSLEFYTDDEEQFFSDDINFRLYAIVGVAWVIYAYTCLLLWYEWIDNLALRRVYYFEYDHHESRMEELQQCMRVMKEARQRNQRKRRDGCDDDDEDEINLYNRPQHIPHPELRELVPNISLYSVLYRFPQSTTIPVVNTNTSLEADGRYNSTNDDNNNASPMSSLPQQGRQQQAAPNSSQSIRSQLQRVVEFFDSCIPNQPGYTSSVAAVTVLPNASQLYYAWKVWYKCTKKVRRLRFIRSLIQKKLREEKRNKAQRDQKRTVEEEIVFSDVEKAEQGEVHIQPTVLDDNANDDTNHKLSVQWSQGTFLANSKAEEQANQQGQEGWKPTLKSIDSMSVREEGRAFYEDNTELQLPDGDDNDIESEAITAKTVTRLTSGIVNTSSATLPVEDSANAGGENEIFTSIELGDCEADTNNVASGLASMENSDDKNGNSALLCEDEEEGIEISHSLTTREEDLDQSVQTAHKSHRRSTTPELWAVKRDYCARDVNKTNAPSREASSSARYNYSPSHPVEEEESKFEYNDVDTDQLISGDDGGQNDEPDDDHGYPEFTYAEFHKTRIEFCREFGFEEESDMGIFIKHLGIEQISVYGRELAQASSRLCPFGCDEFFIHVADLEKLRQLEAAAEDDVRQTYFELVQAKATVNRRSLNTSNLQKILEKEDSSPVGQTPSRMPNNRLGSESSIILRRRKTDIYRPTSADRWQQAQSIAMTSHRGSSGSTLGKLRVRQIQDGSWNLPLIGAFRKIFERDRSQHSKVLRHAATMSSQAVSTIVEDSTYAVVTFTSRQAAIAARQCLADGRGSDRWKEVQDIPTAPLADAPPLNCWSGRGLMRPVTLAINDQQKMVRRYLARILLFLFCFFYTVPLTFASAFLEEESLDQIFKFLGRYYSSDMSQIVAGLLTGSTYTLFLSICPHLFKMIADMGSGAHSGIASEDRALQFYWLFMLLTAFTTTSLATMVTNGINNSLNLGKEFQVVLIQVAAVVPTQMSATWINWIIVRTTIVLPFSYLLQCNTFIFNILGLKCLARVVRGGGPGGPVPFRIYVDSGVVFLCVAALAPASPLVAPFAFVYFLVFSPMIRWLVIFVYRPQSDAGGQRWPFVFQIFISSMIFAQIILTTMMVLKQAPGPAILAGISIVPTYVFNNIAYDRFLRAYQDAGLLQTSNLDGWDRSIPTTSKKREEYRNWLVDCHKASYVPVCLAGVDNFLTAEPAVAIPTADDADVSVKHVPSAVSASSSTIGTENESSHGRGQLGAIFKRSSMAHNTV